MIVVPLGYFDTTKVEQLLLQQMVSFQSSNARGGVLHVQFAKKAILENVPFQSSNARGDFLHECCSRCTTFPVFCFSPLTLEDMTYTHARVGGALKPTVISVLYRSRKCAALDARDNA